MNILRTIKLLRMTNKSSKNSLLSLVRTTRLRKNTSSDLMCLKRHSSTSENTILRSMGLLSQSMRWQIGLMMSMVRSLEDFTGRKIGERDPWSKVEESDSIRIICHTQSTGGEMGPLLRLSIRKTVVLAGLLPQLPLWSLITRSLVVLWWDSRLSS